MYFNLGKNFDRSASLGPSIVVGELDASNLAVETRVSGELRQSYNSIEMVFSSGSCSNISRATSHSSPATSSSAERGAGTAPDSTKLNADGSRPLDRFLKKSQVVEVSSPAIGTRTSTIV
ncbi:MAG: fumarylacetoacetate hydrolase family protein [Chloroflexota bacterium]|nr:fumarylacetoacetate hydrolase family protein [Chloroflexota bacterium]